MVRELIQVFGGDGDCWIYLSEEEIKETSMQERHVQKAGGIPYISAIIEYLRSARVHCFLFCDEEELCPYCGASRYGLQRFDQMGNCIGMTGCRT